jgi:NAD(P)-dependent dehydrogenase (short-subunit alcohol dehydrogenase family)
MDLQLQGKTAIVTGGSRGIGKAVARELGNEGVDVVIVARDQSALDTTAAELRDETRRQIIPISADTSSDDAVKHMVSEAARQLGHIDILVNCAAQAGGQTPAPKLAGITDEAFWADMNVKVMGYIRCIREVAPHMIAQKWGRIINISGLAARQTGNAIGSMRNVSVVSLTKNFADELGPQGINVTVIHPGMTFTERGVANVQRVAQAQGISEDEAKQRLFTNNAIGQLIDATDIGAIVTFLASPRAKAINGDVIAAGGGARGSIHY